MLRAHTGGDTEGRTDCTPKLKISSINQHALPKFSSREAEASIQKAIQDVESGVETSPPTFVHCLPLPLLIVLLGVSPNTWPIKPYYILIRRIKLLNRYTNVSPGVFQ